MKTRTILLYVTLSLCVLPYECIAVGRASGEQIDDLREEASFEKLLTSPTTNYNRVCSLFLTSRNPNLAEAVVEVRHRLENEEFGAEDRAALAVMYARGERALRISMARKMRDSSCLVELPKLLIPTLVKIYSELPEMYDGKLLNELCREINRLLMEHSADISGEFIRRLVEENYIDSRRKPLDSLAAARVVDIYRRLGITGRLAKELSVPPKEIKDNKVLFRTMQLADATEGEFSAVPYAEELLARSGKTGNIDIIACGTIMAREAPAKAIELLPAYAEKITELYIDLHTAANLLYKNGTDEKGNYEWLGKYVAKAEGRLNEKDGRILRLRAYRSAILMLEQRVDNDAIVFLCEAMDKSADASDKACEDYWPIVFSRGKALSLLGKKEEAIAVYEQARDYEFLAERLRNQARRAISELEKIEK